MAHTCGSHRILGWAPNKCLLLVPDENAYRVSLALHKASDCFPSERGLECEVEPFCDGTFEQLLSLTPGLPIRGFLADVRISRKDQACRFVRIEVPAARFQEHGPAEAALTSTVGARQYVKCMASEGRHHAFGPMRPQPCRVPAGKPRKRPSCQCELWRCGCEQAANQILR